MESTPQVALVTGGNRGLGLEVCRQLGRQGWRVLLAARDMGSGEQAARELKAQGLDVVAVPLDVASPESREALARRLEQEGVRLNALVNNAGVAMDGFNAHVAEVTVATNFFGPLHLTERLRPLLAEHARIVMVSSGVGELSGMPAESRKRFDPPPPKEQLMALMSSFVEDVRGGQHSARGWPSSAYRVSKVGLNALTRLLAEELKPAHLLINAVCPGWVRTRMGGSSAPRGVEEGADTIVWAATLPPSGPTGGFFRNRRAIPW